MPQEPEEEVVEFPETPQEKHRALIEELGMSPDDAAHMLVDAGEIDSDQHADLLSPEEAERIYG